jgi:hypothetical protein
MGEVGFAIIGWQILTRGFWAKQEAWLLLDFAESKQSRTKERREPATAGTRQRYCNDAVFSVA